MRKEMSTFVIGAVLAVALSAEAGISYSMQVTSDGDGGRQEAARKVLIRGMIQNSNARMEFQSQPSGSMPGGGYMLIKDNGTTVYMIDPSNKKYFSMGGADVSKMSAGMMNIKISNVKVEKLADNDGGRILGYPVRLLKLRTSYIMEMSIMGGNKMSNNVVQEDEMWLTSKIEMPNFDKWLRPEMGQLGEEFKKISDAMQQHTKGFPLKMISIRSDTNGAGQVRKVKTVMEMTEIQEKDISQSMFEIPAGYTKLDMPVMPGTGAMGPSGEDDE